MSTHLGAAAGEIAPTVLMPGDPLRAKWIAETFLDDARCYNEVRGMLGFTGTWRGQPVSVQGSGMGQPSMAIYVEELLREYAVHTVVRVGSCGSLKEEVKLRDIVLASGACTNSSMNRVLFENQDYAPVADFGLLRAAYDVSSGLGLDADVHVGLMFATDTFYNPRPDIVGRMAEYGVLGIDMESSTLYTLAAKHGARALCVCTVSDHIVTGEETTSQEREQTFAAMVDIALGASLGTA